MKASIVMTSYCRPNYLRLCLSSIKRQNLDLDYEIIVINDGPADDGTKEIVEESGLNTQYIHSGIRNDHQWRVMGFAANIGIRHSNGEVVVLTNSDLWHLGDTVSQVVQGCINDCMALSTLKDVYDDDGPLIEHLLKNGENSAVKEIVVRIRAMPHPVHVFPSNPDMPFFMAVRREHLEKIGAYDEEFIGVASEDCDLVDRLLGLGCHYCYAKDAEAIHLYHNRRTISELQGDQGFIYNVKLRYAKRGQLVRNVGKPWGELTSRSNRAGCIPIHMILWVTTNCNLHCPNCNQQDTINAFPGYSMEKNEFKCFIYYCQKRDIHFSTIELTGGEPTLWPLFEWALERLRLSGITDDITFITNGNDAARTAKIANRLGIKYTVSVKQAGAKSVDIHVRQGVGAMWIDNEHKPLPTKSVPNSLPASCSQIHDRSGRAVCQLCYIKGNVYYCCLAHANSIRVGTDPRYVCSFEDDFITYFANRQFNVPICSVCICNEKVWRTL